MKKIIFNNGSERIKFECKLIDCVFDFFIKTNYLKEEALTYYEENEDCVHNTALGEKLSLSILNSLKDFSKLRTI